MRFFVNSSAGGREGIGSHATLFVVMWQGGGSLKSSSFSLLSLASRTHPLSQWKEEGNTKVLRKEINEILV